jgi:hypothetical protein
MSWERRRSVRWEPGKSEDEMVDFRGSKIDQRVSQLASSVFVSFQMHFVDVSWPIFLFHAEGSSSYLDMAILLAKVHFR